MADNTKLKQRLRHQSHQSLEKGAAPNDNTTTEPEAADAAVYESDFSFLNN